MNKTIIQLLVIFFIMIPWFIILDYVNSNDFLICVFYSIYVNYLVRKFIVDSNNDFDDITCLNCKNNHCAYDKHCFHCWAKNLDNI